MKNFKLAGMLMLALGLSACGLPSQMHWAKNPMQVQPEKAKVVFIRDSIIAGALDAVVFSYDDAQPQLLGFSVNGTQVEALVNPGKHTFFATTNIAKYSAANFMLADLAPGKTYYVIVTPNWGLGQFFLHPVHKAAGNKFVLGSAEVNGLIKSTKPVELTAHAVENLHADPKWDASVLPARFSGWQTKPDQTITAVTIVPEDGI